MSDSGASTHQRRVVGVFEHHIFICTNTRPVDHPRGCCDPDALAELQLAFKKELAARGLKDTVRANKAGCLEQCEHGPSVVVYPEAVWYGRVTIADVAEIVESHIVNRQPVARLRLPDQCINTSGCEHKPEKKR